MDKKKLPIKIYAERHLNVAKFRNPLFEFKGNGGSLHKYIFRLIQAFKHCQAKTQGHGFFNEIPSGLKSCWWML